MCTENDRQSENHFFRRSLCVRVVLNSSIYHVDVSFYFGAFSQFLHEVMWENENCSKGLICFYIVSPSSYVVT